MSALRIVGGTVYDPANGVDGDVRDICVRDGQIVAELPSDAPRIDARGMVVMPGGIDIHAHVASASVNLARLVLPEEHAVDPAPAPRLERDEVELNPTDQSSGAGRSRAASTRRGAAFDVIPRSGSGGTVPSTFTTGYRYAGLGYTTVFDAAVAPISARSTHAQFDDTPIVDGGFFALLGNDEYLLRQIAAGERERARDYVAWLLGATKAYAIKIVNAGGVELWKRNVREIKSLDDPVGAANVTPRAILETLTDAGNALGLPHPVHIHCNNLGLPGNVGITLDSMRAVGGRRAHFTHLQFQSYAKPWGSAAKQIAEYFAAHPEVSGDVGQVMFGPATTLTADGAVEYLLHMSTGRKWVNVDIELETGCGVVPYVYRDTAAVAALQWVVGLELFLLSPDPWRLVLSTDHPNGGSFMSYPELIRLLMDRTYRDDRLKRINQKHLAGSALADGLSREYTLGEIAIITRAGPARLLGLTSKGHLGPGADADITVYARSANAAEMFATPRYVIKAGTLVVEEGQLRRAPSGRRLYNSPGYDHAVERDIRKYFEQYVSVEFDNYAVTL